MITYFYDAYNITNFIITRIMVIVIANRYFSVYNTRYTIFFCFIIVKNTKGFLNANNKHITPINSAGSPIFCIGCFFIWDKFGNITFQILNMIII